MNGNRQYNLDVLKGLSMALVVLGHIIQCCNGVDYMSKGDFFDNALYKLIYSFHLPMFAVISGWLFFFSAQRHTFIDNIKNKSCQLLLPIATIMIVFLLIDLVVEKNFRGGLILHSFTNAVEALWFLWALFMAFMVVGIMSKYCNTLYLELIYAIVVIVCIFFVDLPLFVNPHKYIISFYILGYLLNKYKDTLLIAEKKIRIVLLPACMGGVFFYILSDTRLHLYTHFSLYGNILEFLAGFPQRIMLCSMSTYAVYHTVTYIYNRLNKDGYIINMFKSFSKYSIGLYFYQCVFFYLFLNYYYIDFTSFCWFRIILLFVLLVGVCFALSYLSEKNRVTRKIILGHK